MLKTTIVYFLCSPESQKSTHSDWLPASQVLYHLVFSARFWTAHDSTPQQRPINSQSWTVRKHKTKTVTFWPWSWRHGPCWVHTRNWAKFLSIQTSCPWNNIYVIITLVTRYTPFPPGLHLMWRCTKNVKHHSRDFTISSLHTVPQVSARFPAESKLPDLHQWMCCSVAGTPYPGPQPLSERLRISSFAPGQ